jgi:hypothetical protein
MAAPSRNAKEYSKFELIFGNLAIILWIGLGAISCGIFSIWIGLVYFALVAFLIYFEIGKHGCVTCYYCKTCTIGMGKLPELFFRMGGTANVNRRALKLFRAVYLLLSLVPCIAFAVSITQELLVFKITLLAVVLGFVVYTGAVRRAILV